MYPSAHKLHIIVDKLYAVAAQLGQWEVAAVLLWYTGTPVGESTKDLFSLKKNNYNFPGCPDQNSETEMTDFKASVVAFEVQKNFANKFFSNKSVAKSLIDDTSGNLLDNLYLLLYVFVSMTLTLL